MVRIEPANRDARTRHAGRWAVLAMFAFAVMVTGLLYFYWDRHTAPFRPLQEAIAREYEGSQPLVQGGQRKIHEGSPRLLRVTLRVEFDPNAEPNEQRVQEIVDRIEDLAGKHHPLPEYDTLEVHLVHLRPERQPQLRQIDRKVSH